MALPPSHQPHNQSHLTHIYRYRPIPVSAKVRLCLRPQPRVASVDIIQNDKLGGPWYVVASVWAKARRDFRHKERHWKEKIIKRIASSSAVCSSFPSLPFLSHQQTVYHPPVPHTPSRLSHNDPTIQIFCMLYLTLVTYLLAMTIPESQGRWSALSKDIVSLISYAHLTISPGVDASWLSPFGIDDTCHPLNLSTPTPTVVPSTPATRTVSAITASPIAFNPVLYKDIFAVQLEITKAPRSPKRSKSAQGRIPCGVESAHLLVARTGSVGPGSEL